MSWRRVELGHPAVKDVEMEVVVERQVVGILVVGRWAAGILVGVGNVVGERSLLDRNVVAV